MATFEFLPEQRIIQLGAGTTAINVTDMYSRWKDWVLTNPNWLNAFRVVGGDPTIGGNQISPYFFLTNGWRVRPQEANHTLQVDGILLVDGGGDPYLDTIGTYQIRIQAIVPLEAEFVVAQLPEIEFASFQNAVWVDTGSNRSGTEYPTGTRQYPVNNIPDARAILDQQGFGRMGLLSNVTFGLGDNIEDLTIFGRNKVLTHVQINDEALTLRCEFQNLTIDGVLDGDSFLRFCNIGTLNYVNGEIHECRLDGTITLGGNKFAHLVDCYSGVPGTSTPTIDMGGTGHALGIRDYHGGIRLINKTGPESVSIDLSSGQIVLDETVTNGTLVLRGLGKLTDNSTGTANVLSEDLLNRNSISDAVLNEDIAQFSGNGTDSVADALQAVNYHSMVVIDAINGVAGTIYPTGTPRRPVNNLADATLIAQERGISTFFLNSDITVPFDHVAISDATIIGRGTKFVTVTIQPGAQFQKIRVENLTAQGSGSTTAATFFRCSIRDLEVIGEAQFWECDLGGTLTLHDETTIDNCRDIIPGIGLPTIQKGGINAFNVGVWSYYGGLRIANSNCAGCSWSFNIDSGRIVLDETVVGGNILIRGIGVLVDNSVGTTVDATALLSNASIAGEISVDSQVIAGAVWDKQLSEHTTVGSAGNALSTASTGGVDVGVLANAVWNKPVAENQQAGSFGEYINLIDQTVTRIRNLSEGNWEIDGTQLVMYSTSGLEIARFNLFDQTGTPSNKEVFSRERV